MKARNVKLAAILAAVIATVVVVLLVQSSQLSPQASAPSPSATAPSAENGSSPGQEQAPSSGQPLYPPRPLAAADPLVSAPLPETAHRDRAIVEGFPAVISLAPASEVMFSSVASERDRVQAGLDAMSSSAPAAVLAHYRSTFATLGLVEEPVSAADGSQAVAFDRGPSTITVTVWPTDTGSRYTVFGVLVAGI